MMNMLTAQNKPLANQRERPRRHAFETKAKPAITVESIEGEAGEGKNYGGGRGRGTGRRLPVNAVLGGSSEVPRSVKATRGESHNDQATDKGKGRSKPCFYYIIYLLFISVLMDTWLRPNVVTRIPF